MTKITVLKEKDWSIERYAKAPLELLLCDDLQPNSKLLWIILANQTSFGPIDKGLLDRRIGIHRATRIRCMTELRELGFIDGSSERIIVRDPLPVLRKLRVADEESRKMAEEILSPEFYEIHYKPRIQTKNEKPDYAELARMAWNNYRPKDYAKINKMSDQLMKSLDLHIKALKLTPHDYEHFFSILKAGVDHSPFWSKENTSKTLQSIIGIGAPMQKKYQNVYSLYNEGFNYGEAEATDEEDRIDRVVLPARLRKLIDRYDELHYLYFNMLRNDPGSIETLSDQILEVEQQLVAAKLDPSKFRMKYQLPSWPSDIPEPEHSRERFWVYDDEL